MENRAKYIVIGVSVASGLIALGIILFALRVPVYATVTDGQICGYETESVESRAHKFKECPNPNKLDHYGRNQPVEQSIQIPAPGQESKMCTQMKKNFENSKTEKIVWRDQRSSTRVQDVGFLKMHTYACSALAQWQPVYKVERWEGCGEAPFENTEFEVPKTCADKSKQLGTKWRWQK